MMEDSLKINDFYNADSSLATVSAKADSVPRSVRPVDCQTAENTVDSAVPQTMFLGSAPMVSEGVAGASVADTAELDSGFLFGKYGFFKGSRWINENDTVHFVGLSGDPVPYKLSNDVYVTGTLLLCLFMAAFLVSRSMHALGLQIKNFFYNRDRNESLSLKSEGQAKNQIFFIVFNSFVLSLLFFSYAEFKLIGSFTTVSPYLLLFADMAVCLAYFVLKQIVYSVFNWVFFDEDSREIWSTNYSFIIFGKSITLLPLVLAVLYVGLPLEVCILIFTCVLAVYESMVLFKTKQIFFGMRFGLIMTILYFCTLELLPLFFLWEMLIRTNEFLLI